MRTAAPTGIDVLNGRPRPAGRWLLVSGLLAALLGGACVPDPPARSPEPTAVPSPADGPALPAGWVEHELDGSGVRLGLPGEWLVLDEAALADPDRRREIERDFAGAEALFTRLDAQGRRVRIVLLAIDPRARGTGTFPPVVTVVAVEPALPPLLLGLGADFVESALGGAFTIETDISRADLETPIGDGIQLAFSHRILGPEGGPGTLVEHDGVLVTTGRASFLVSRTVDPGTEAAAGAPSIEDVAATLSVRE